MYRQAGAGTWTPPALPGAAHAHHFVHRIWTQGALVQEAPRRHVARPRGSDQLRRQLRLVLCKRGPTAVKKVGAVECCLPHELQVSRFIAAIVMGLVAAQGETRNAAGTPPVINCNHQEVRPPPLPDTEHESRIRMHYHKQTGAGWKSEDRLLLPDQKSPCVPHSRVCEAILAAGCVLDHGVIG